MPISMNRTLMQDSNYFGILTLGSLYRTRVELLVPYWTLGMSSSFKALCNLTH